MHGAHYAGEPFTLPSLVRAIVKAVEPGHSVVFDRRLPTQRRPYFPDNRNGRFLLGLKRKTVAVDLDGVCADYYGGLRPIAAKWLDVPIQQLPTRVSIGLKEWGVDRRSGGFEALHRYALEEHQLFLQLDPIPGAAQGLRWLGRNCDFAVRIVTNRLVIKNLAYMAVSQTTEWLNVHEIPYDEICFVDDKRTVRADIYIEDSPTNIRRLRDAGKTVIAFKSAITGDVSPPLLSAWDDLTHVVESLRLTE